MLSCNVRRAGDDTVADLSNDQIIKIVLDDLNKTMDITMGPDFVVVGIGVPDCIDQGEAQYSMY